MSHNQITLKSAATLLLVGIVAAPAARADWTGKGEGGLLFSSGNTSATSANAKLDVSDQDGAWKNNVFLAGLYGKSNGVISGERIEGRYELDRKITDQLFWFVGLNGVKDQFSGFAYQVSAVGGLGYQLISNADTKLSLTAGLGYRSLETQQLIKDSAGSVVQRINGASNGDAVLNLGANFEQKLTATTKLFDKLAVVTGSNDTNVSNDLGLQVAMNSKLALSVGYGVRYNTDPAAGVKKLDQLTTLNVVYNIK